MNTELPHLSELERFSSGLMSGPELAEFNKRLAKDNSLAEELHVFQHLKAGIRSFHRKRLLAQMESYEDQLNTGGTQSFFHIFPLRKFSIAASVAVLLGAGIFMWNKQNQKTDNWQTALVDDPGLPVLMSADQNAYSKAMNFYHLGQFEEAISSLPANNTDTSAYYRGIFYLKLQKPDSAFRYLHPLLGNTRSAFAQKADYYAAMALWQNGEKSQAREAFRKIADNTEHPFSDIAAGILQRSF